MIIHRSNPETVHHHAPDASAALGKPKHSSMTEDCEPTSNRPRGAGPGDILYGAAAIAAWLFPKEPEEPARRRVYNLWHFHRDRKEKAGFFKLKGALCLSKSQWLAFHGLG